jgi:hypothetical protein
LYFKGNCYIFNSGKNSTNHSIPELKSNKAGALNGLQVTKHKIYSCRLHFPEFNTNSYLVVKYLKPHRKIAGYSMSKLYSYEETGNIIKLGRV